MHGGDVETILSNYTDMMYDHAYKEQLRLKATQKRQATLSYLIKSQDGKRQVNEKITNSNEENKEESKEGGREREGDKKTKKK